MTVYTRNGDDGTSSLIGSDNVPKNSAVFNVLGTVDELNACLGCMSRCRMPRVKEIIYDVQNDLFLIGTLVATSNKNDKMIQLEKKVAKMEKTIDELEEDLPELTNFIVPGGTETATMLHMARAFSRRLEREFVSYLEIDNKKEFQGILKYLNRLSDLLFTLARYANHRNGVKEKVWKFSI